MEGIILEIFTYLCLALVVCLILAIIKLIVTSITGWAWTTRVTIPLGKWEIELNVPFWPCKGGK